MILIKNMDCLKSLAENRGWKVLDFLRYNVVNKKKQIKTIINNICPIFVVCQA